MDFVSSRRHNLNCIVDRESGFNAGVTIPTCNTRTGLSGTTA